jgi:alpha-L-fucosidase 2
MVEVDAQKGGKLKMWYDKPAANWNEALPVGNGRLGAMIYGIPDIEKIQLNENSFWSGGPSRNDNPKALSALANVRNLIFNGDYSSVESLINTNMTATTLHGSKYQVVGNLNITFNGHSAYNDYYRELDLERAVFSTSYKVDGVTYKREVIASQPDQVIAVRLTASESGKLTFAARFNGILAKTTKALDDHTLEMTGLSSTHEGVTGKVKFDARARFINSGGTTAISSDTLKVVGADEVIILISIATNFVDYLSLTADESAKCINYLEAAGKRTYSSILSDHIAAFQKYFGRVNFNLGTSPMASYPTNIRIKNFSKSYDPELVSMYYQFGRYLLISSSQPGGQPANLQGLWNDGTDPSWDSKYTLNINTEMNYWPAEKCNLTEMHEPLMKMIKELSKSGSETAKTMYGCDGWVVHHNTDIWRISGVVDGAYWGMWPMGGAWLSQHLWEKYLYSGDVTFLDSIYPILKSACEFYQDFLVPEPKNKWLVVSPSNSPENNPSVHPTSISAGTTMDNQILFDLFTKTIKAASILKRDSVLMVDFKTILDQLAPMQIGKLGQLQEWMDDWDSPTDQNRHVSHLYGLFPSNQISPYSSPKLFDAARTSLLYRGDVSTGWSMGWKVNFWARLLDGNHARKLISDQLIDPTNGSGGTYPNFFDAHPPFQIDGNFGCTSGITEMLLQSHDGAIHFLPALPDDWKKTGEIDGLRAYGGFDVSFSWENGIVQKITIKSNLGGNCRIRVPNEIALNSGVFLKTASGINPNPFFSTAQIKSPLIVDTTKLKPVKLDQTFLYDMSTEAGQTYTLVIVKSPDFKNASVEKANAKQIIVNLSDPLKVERSYTGFYVKVDNVAVDIDSVVAGKNADLLVINLKNKILKTNSVLLSYNNGNVVSIYNKNLKNFTDSLVENILPGAAPRIINVTTSEDGKSIIAHFNMKMKLPNNLSLLTVSAVYDGSKDISLLQSSFVNNDSTSVSFSLFENVFADYNLYLNYSGQNVVSADSGVMKAINKMEIKNNSFGIPLQIMSGKLETGGSIILLKCNKPLGLILNQEPYFTIKINNKPFAIKEIKGSNDTLIVSFTKTIRFGDAVTLSYAKGRILSRNNGILESFNDYALVNSILEPVWVAIPSRIEAENFILQYGTQNETTGDTDGKLNVGSIDTDDWFDYAINNTTADSIFTFDFRVAGLSASNVITLYLDDIKLGQIYLVNTGGKQIYQTVSKNFKVKAGKHYLRLYATAGGFNINYFSIQKEYLSNIVEINSNKIKVYPNPLSNDLYIETAGFKYDKIEITDISGSLVASQLITYGPKVHIPVNLPNGMYILKISNKNDYQIKKIMVKRN